MANKGQVAGGMIARRRRRRSFWSKNALVAGDITAAANEDNDDGDVDGNSNDDDDLAQGATGVNLLLELCRRSKRLDSESSSSLVLSKMQSIGSTSIS